MRNSKVKEKLNKQLPQTLFVNERLPADNEFDKRFNQNRFVVSCSVCDRLWFKRDIRPIPAKAIEIIRKHFPKNVPTQLKVCENCHKSLNYGKFPYGNYKWFL